MPELPDVEVFARDFAANALNRRIETVDLRDPERLRGARPDDLTAALTGFHFDSVTRHGKILFLGVSSGWKLAIHFGMNGHIALYGDAHAEPEHTRLVLDFADGGRWAFANMRRLGWVELTDDIAAYLRNHEVGPDALTLDAGSFAKRVGGKRGAIKSALMDQATVAGIGNVYADEILFHAGIIPDRPAHDLDDPALNRLHGEMQAILREAADRGGFHGELPAGWLYHQRGDAGHCPVCGHTLNTRQVGGRTSYLCPACQT